MLIGRWSQESAKGFCSSGGSVCLILESVEAARGRDADVKALLCGWGQASDCHNVAISHAEGDGLAQAMENALRDAQDDVDQIGYIHAHATSTTVGDRSEAAAIGRVFARHSQVPVSSTKALTGHTLSMAGALEAAVSCVALREGLAFPQAHLQCVDSECEHLNLPKSAVPMSAPYVLSNSSGFGGSNVSLVLRRPE